MEENKDNDIIYDLDHEEIAEEPKLNSSENSDNSVNSDSSENSDNSDNSENSENPDNSDNEDAIAPARKEIDRMVEKMGAETLLEIIRDNRNAAIRQIIHEVEASQIRTPPSGDRCTAPCSSIFDLAAMA